MMTPLDQQCHTVLLAAASAEVGLVLRTNDPYKARASLYRFRNAIGDVELKKLQIRVSPDDSENEIWIIRQSSISLSLAAS